MITQEGRRAIIETVCREWAKEIVARLFVNGNGQMATRLAMVDDKSVHDLGSWSAEAVETQIVNELVRQLTEGGEV